MSNLSIKKGNEVTLGLSKGNKFDNGRKQINNSGKHRLTLVVTCINFHIFVETKIYKG